MPSQVRGVLSWCTGPLRRIEVMCAIVCQMPAFSIRPRFAQAADSCW